MDDSALNYIMIYYYNTKKEFIFVNIIDGSALENPKIQISDYIITNNNEIIIADSSQSRLLFFDYSADNVVSLKL